MRENLNRKLLIRCSSSRDNNNYSYDFLTELTTSTVPNNSNNLLKKNNGNR